ncbi:MAG: hypothetical protein JWN52_7749 [Actinomycetia bacterium]|nr:hypothetical protein [Actinomycetes bacterium]
MLKRFCVGLAVAGAALALTAAPANAAVKHSFTTYPLTGAAGSGWWTKTNGKVTVRLCVKDTTKGKRGAAVDLQTTGKIEPVDAYLAVSVHGYGKVSCHTFTIHGSAKHSSVRAWTWPEPVKPGKWKKLY